ncbi:MAG: class I SAM-dependent DNA methyltransferase [Chloroflexi bacterium]|nr:class I SAM-dependent DNA methyltransferase [Chloroflexota bacterium]
MPSRPHNTADYLANFHAKLAATRVLDPACGSGNFLYVALQKLLDLQKEVIVFAQTHHDQSLPLTVSPQQLYGIEINPYAHELAQITAWIGYLQWRAQNGFEEMDDPVLRPLGNIQRMDAILAYDADGQPVEPAWPAAEVIIGNPPFLGGNKMRQELGDKMVDTLFKLSTAVPGFADLVCYWFEKAREQIQHGHTQRAGLISTNSIRGGANREVLRRIKETGDIFMAWADNPWVLDGAAVRVSLVGFDNGSHPIKRLDGQDVPAIHPDLTALVTLQLHHPCRKQNLSFLGTLKRCF